MRAMRILAGFDLRRRTANVAVEGADNVPRAGAALIVARHYHHLLDGELLLDRFPRPIHIVVALDWAAGETQRRRMETACRWAQWPVILRPGSLAASASYTKSELLRYLRTGIRHAATLLAAGRVVAIFPEGYPAVDAPGRTGQSIAGPSTPRDAAGFLRFAEGFRTIVAEAHRLGSGPIPIVPLGFSYERTGTRWHVTMRIGRRHADTATTERIEEEVRRLSRP